MQIIKYKSSHLDMDSKIIYLDEEDNKIDSL